MYIERLWRTIKYEAIYLNEYDDFEAIQQGIKEFIKFYNEQRYHQSLKYLRPADVYHAEAINLKLITKGGCQNESLTL